MIKSKRVDKRPIYRSLSAGVALVSIFPIFFASLIKIALSIPLFEKDVLIRMSIYDALNPEKWIEKMFGEIESLKQLMNGDSMTSALQNIGDEYKKAMVIMIIFFAIAIVSAILAIIFNAVSNKHRWNFIFGGIGFASIVGSGIAFRVIIVALREGAMTLGTFIDGGLGDLAGSLIRVSAAGFGSLFLLSGLCFIILIGLALGDIIISDEPKEKKKAKKKVK